MGREGVCLHSHQRFFVRRQWKKNRRGWRESSARDEKGGTEEARVTEEFRNDRRPVASLTDDALLRSRLQAQKDGTAVMDSKWLEIVGRCHRATPFCLSFSSFPRSRSLSLSPLAICIFFHPSFETHGTRYTPSKTDRRAWNFTRFSSIFCASELSLAQARLRYVQKVDHSPHTEYFIEYIAWYND